MQKRLLCGFVFLIACAMITGLVGIPLHAEDGPSLEILAPSTGQVINGPKLPISLTFQNNTDVPFVHVDFALDGIHFFGGPFRTPTAVGRLDTDSCDITRAKNATPGPHTLSIRLMDAQGGVVERTLQINYQPVNLQASPQKPPRVRIISPKSGDIIDKKTDIQVEATSSNGLKFVKVFVDGRTVAFTNDASSLFTWDPINDKIASGPHTLLASAWDLFDAQGDSDPVTVTVVNSWLPANGNNTTIEGTDTQVLETTNPLTVVAGPTPIIAGGMLIAQMPFAMPQLPGFTGNINTPIPDFFPMSPLSYAAPTAALGTPAAILAQTLPSLPANTGNPVVGTPALGTPGPAARATAQTLQPTHVVGMAPKAPAGLTAANQMVMVPAPLATPQLPGMPGATKTANPAPPVAYAAPATHLGAPATLPTQSLPGLPANAVTGTPALATPTQATRTMQPLHPAQATGMNPKAPQRLTAPMVSTPMRQSRPSLVTPTPQGTPAPIATAPAVPGHLPAMTEAVMPSMGARPRPIVIADAGATAPAVPIKTAPAKPAPVLSTKTKRLPVVPVATDPLAGLKNHYVVVAGDTLSKVARTFNTTNSALLRMNPAIDPEQLVVGTKLLLPRHAMRITLDETTLTSVPTAYQLGQGYTMVPMRSMIEAKGGILVWMPKSHEVNAWVRNNALVIKIGDRQARVNSQSLLMPVAAILRNSRTMVPLRCIANSIGLEVTDDPTNKLVTISSR
jgi:LysM repeat protein